MATGEFAYGASLSALGPVMLPDAGLLSELNAPKGKPRMRTLIQCPDIVPCTSASWRAGLPTRMEKTDGVIFVALRRADRDNARVPWLTRCTA